MRRALVFALAIAAAVPATAVAAPQLKCNYDGNKTKVVIVNDGQDAQCNYACNFTLDGGSRSVSGSIGVKAGETKTVDEDTARGKVTGVRSQTLDCK